MRKTWQSKLSFLVVVLISCLALPPESQSAEPIPEIVVVSGTRLTETPLDQPYAFYRTVMEDLDGRVGRVALDRMNYGPGVFIQRTAPNQASPFIRGLTGEQTLLMLDGIRLSHAFMRPGPNQYAALVPDLGISSVDSILGSSSTVNGSDGLTGALDFRLAQPGRGVDSGYKAWARTRLDTGNGVTVEAGIDGAKDDWAYTFEVGHSDFHDREGADGFEEHLFGPAADADDEIPNTAYEAYSAGFRVSYQGVEDHYLQLSFGHKRQEDAPRPGGYFENSGRSDRVYRFFDPQEFTYLHLQDHWFVGGEIIERLDTKVWWHGFSEEQFRSSVRDQGDPGERIRRREYDNALDAIGIDVQATSLVGERHELTWGFTYIDETTDNSYREFRTPVGSTDLSLLAPHGQADWPNRTTVSDDSNYETLGVFLQDNWAVTDTLTLVAGVRYSAYDWSFGAVNGDTDDISGSLRGIWSPADNHRIFVGISRGFRAPNLTNLNGLSDRGSSGIEAQGNPDLDPEVSLTYELGWKWQEDGNSFSLTLFQTDVDDLIQQDFSVTPAVTTNVEGAEIYGFETAWDYGFDLGDEQRLAFVGSISRLHATRDIPLAGGGTFEDYISRANRFYGVLGVEFSQGQNWSGLLQMRFHAAYDDVATHPSDSDARDIRLTVAGGPDGSMPSYGVLDAVVGWKSDDGKLGLRFFIENINDKLYREPGSGVDGVGRNFGLTASVGF